MTAAPIPSQPGPSIWCRAVSGNAAVVAIRLLSVLAGLAYVKVYSGALSASDIGTFFYLSTLSYALNALIFVPVDFYMQARISRLNALPVRGLRQLVARVLAIALLAFLVLSAPLVWLAKLSLADLPLLYAMASLLYLCTSARGTLNNRGAKVFVSFMLLLEAVGRLGAFVGIAAVFGASARTLMASAVLALAVELLIIVAQARRQLHFTNEPGALDTPRTILKITAPIASSAVGNAVQLQAYRVAYPLAGLGATSGIFGVVSNIGAAGMAACGSIFSQIHVPQLYQTQGASIRRFVSLAVTMTVAILAVTLGGAPYLVRWLTQPEYVPYAFAIGFGVLIEACNLIIGAYTVLLTIEGRAGMLLKFSALAALLSVAGCVAAMRLQPGDPFIIGYAVAGSQLLMTALLVIFATPRPTAKTPRRSAGRRLL